MASYHPYKGLIPPEVLGAIRSSQAILDAREHWVDHWGATNERRTVGKHRWLFSHLKSEEQYFRTMLNVNELAVMRDRLVEWETFDQEPYVEELKKGQQKLKK